MDQRRAENEFKKSFLRSYRRIKRNVAVLSDQIAELRAAKMGVSCGIGDGMPHAHAGSDLSDYAAKFRKESNGTFSRKSISLDGAGSGSPMDWDIL